MKNPADNIFDKFISYAKENGISLGGKILIGLSGGADSVSLLLLLLKAGADVRCVHVNHMIRGAEADRDEAFCRDLCAKYGVDFQSYRVNIPQLSEERHTGTEETARDERRRILISSAKESGCESVALAHNKNDRAETLLFNLARGTGVRGLGSIRPVRDDNGIRIIRPLLCLSKDEILSFLKENGQEHIFDSTNSDTDYTRNYIRQVLLPVFERINPAYLSNINKAADLCREADGFITECAYKFIAEHEQPDKDALSALHPAVFKKVFSVLYEQKCGEALSDTHLYSIFDFVKSAEHGQRLQFPGSTDLIYENNGFVFIKRVRPLEFDIKLELGENIIAGKNYKIFVENANFAKPLDSYINIYRIVKRIKISSDIIKNDIYIRNRRGSDSIRYGNMTHSVKKLLSEKKIPSSLRADYPVIYDKEGLLFVPPFAVRDGIRGDEQIYLTYCES
ncbi:MAG: tRNA lysidine(34) synthetase TilS [Clostridia bacterium]|nr:tRNA lysidine(34) synthetase TilS [Clostridia bacterium]